MFLVHMSKTKQTRWIALTVFFCGVLAVALTLLITVGKDGLIEGVPVWSVYLVLALTNFTSLFAAKQEEADEAKETAAV